MRLRSIALLCLSLLLLGCSSRAPGGNRQGECNFSPAGGCPTEGRPFTVAAAASMQRPLQAIATAFTKQTGQVVTLSFGATGTLAVQIEQGAPFDLFLAADEAAPEQLAQKGLLEGVQRYATGQLVLAVSKRAGVQVSRLQELTNPQIKRISIANPDLAPYGRAAVEALKAAGVWEQVQGKIVLAENIRQTAQFVESGDAETGLIALSDAGSANLTINPIPASLYRPIHQTLGFVKGSPQETVAKQFAQFLASTEAKAILEQYGLAPSGGER